MLAVSGDDDYPYPVPLNYVSHENTIIFHCRKTGYKLDAISRNQKVSFCVIDTDQIVPDEYTSYYRNVVVFGKAHILDDDTEKRNALDILARKYVPGQEEKRMQAINKELSAVCVIVFAIEYMTVEKANRTY